MIDHLYNTLILPYITNPYLPSIFIAFASLVVGIGLRWITGKWLTRMAARSENQYDDILVDALRRSILYVVLLTGLNIALRELPRAKVIMPYARPILTACFIVLLAYILTKVLKMLVRIRAEHDQSRMAAVSLTRRTIEIVVYTVAFVMVLKSFGVDIAPVITALGVGGLAVALALQDTLSNLFAGIYITLARQICVGDYIRISDGFEGYVRDIGWRNTIIEMLEMNSVLIPNNKLAQAIVINYNLPSEIQYLLLTFGVHHQTDPQLVEDVLVTMVNESGSATREEAFESEQPQGKIRGLLCHPEPIVRFREFGEYTLNFRFFVAISHFDLQFEARSNVMKKIYYTFKQAGITVPMPIRALQIGSTPDSSGLPSVSAAEVRELVKEMRRGGQK
ncbi:MAG: mechanosensitive ion channel family protein [Candidatus Kapabacteria bacterium]|jgi:small-conductance mechanosensitive channel|nr:mechanosensitive ion channel family protein [Candidatus Kapabacteria bacterium]